MESIFDVSEPYVYVLILPALLLFALGYRRLAFTFTIGVLAGLTVLKVA